MAFLQKIRDKFKTKKNEDEVIDLLKQKNESLSLKKYEKGLKKTNSGFIRSIKKLANKNFKIDEDFFVELEEILLSSDVGINYTEIIIKLIKSEIKIHKANTSEKIQEIILEFFYKSYIGDDDDSISKLNLSSNKLNIILVIGVNGVGKTTSIAKLANKLINDGLNVMVAAADTFRAGAVKQLEIWAKKLNMEITLPLRENEDPGSVIFRSIKSAKENDTDVLIIDTAGRLHNKDNLMKELEKIHNIISKNIDNGNVESLLVLDATTGQNGILQSSSFDDITNLTGIILTKMDSSSKGGIILPIRHFFRIPVKFIGFGEGINDFDEFDINKYIYSLAFKDNEN